MAPAAPQGDRVTALPSPSVTQLVTPGDKLGYIGKLVTRGSEVFAVGGTYHAPTILYSMDGNAFIWKPPPKTSGLRDLHLDAKQIWVVGEYGMVAASGSKAKRWKEIDAGTSACLYAIDRDAEKRLWITGDDGLVLRSMRNGRFEKIKTLTTGRVLSLYLDPKSGLPWILDTTGMLQTWNGKKFVEVPAAALRTKQSLNEMTRTPSGALVVVANGGAVLRSENDGKTWKKSPTHMRTMIEGIAATRYGVLAVGENATLLVSYDDARTFTAVATEMTGHLWCVASVAGGVLIGGDAGRIYRIAAGELARMMAAAYGEQDNVLGGLALRVHEGLDGAEMVLEDALRERGLW
jgi:photosystem II stability/assembly factor-like uncharacterized protein